MSLFRKLTEGLARKTSRRVFGRGANVVFGTVIGATAGTARHGSPNGCIDGMPAPTATAES